MATSQKPVVEDHRVVTNESALSGKPEYPGQTLGLVALILSFFVQVPALIMGILAWVWSDRAGVSNVPAKVAVAVSATLIVIGTLVLIGWVVLVASTIGQFGGMNGFGPMGEDFFS
jgi:hypothetical protein